jgi:large subunit ribosomal protein L9
VASNIQVILKEDVDKLGKAGDLVKVKPGYARNYLMPRSLAVSATRDNIKRIEHERKAAIAHASKLRKSAEDVAKALSAVVIRIAKPVGENDKLYGSVTIKEVADALEKQGFSIDRKKLALPGPVKQVGEFEIAARLGHEVVARFKLIVEKQETET